MRPGRRNFRRKLAYLRDRRQVSCPPRGLSITNSHVPSAWRRTTSALLPDIVTGLPSASVPLTLHFACVSAIFPSALWTPVTLILNFGFKPRNPFIPSPTPASPSPTPPPPSPTRAPAPT